MTFHLYDVGELYSHADGTIQFVELYQPGGGATGEDEWALKRLKEVQGGTTHTYIFQTALPSNTTINKKVLVATQGFADLGIVTPDYIIPNNFLFITGGGTTTFGTSVTAVDTVVHGNLPTDIAHSIVITRGDDADPQVFSTQLNSPTNFAGVTGHINAPPSLANALADDITGVGQAYSYLPSPSTFSDIEVSEAAQTFSYTATRSTGAALPAWLTVNPSTGELTGTPASTDTGLLSVKLIASDGAGGTAFDIFDVRVISGVVLTGTEAADTLAGGLKNDLLIGLGGIDRLNGGGAADTMEGGLGNDIYTANRSDDQVVEAADGGIDIVKSTATYVLPVNVEKLTLTGAVALNATGNTLDNTLTGNTGNNVITGLEGRDNITGGLGTDTLSGGPNTDFFVFREAPAGDLIVDFQRGIDFIRLDNVYYTSLVSTGTLGAANIQVAPEASINANSGDGDYVKYASDTGHLYYDADGAGDAPTQLIATVYSSGTKAANFILTHDIVVV